MNADSRLDHADPRLDHLLRAVFGQLQSVTDATARAQDRRDFVFHMTDWVGDLQELWDLYRAPDHYTPEQAARIIAGFLYHVIPHLKTAGRLLLDEVSDPFEAIPTAKAASQAMARKKKSKKRRTSAG